MAPPSEEPLLRSSGRPLKTTDRQAASALPFRGPAGPPRWRACLLVDERPVGLGGRSVGEFINSHLLKTCVKESHSDAQESRKKRLADFRSFAAPSAAPSDAFTSARPQPLPAPPHSRRSSFAAMPSVAKCFRPSTMALTPGRPSPAQSQV